MTSGPPDSAPRIAFGRAIAGELAEAERREWLVTNGLGGFASGTIAGTLTRRYHGLLIAALAPPLGRTLLGVKIDESATYLTQSHELATNRWTNGYISPPGYLHVERFFLDGTLPVWHYVFGGALLEKRVWMEQGANTTCVRYRALRAQEPVQLTLRAFVNYRGFHANTHAGDWRIGVVPQPQGVRVDAYPGAVPFWVLADGAAFSAENVWYRDFVLSEEAARGLDDRDDHLAAAVFTATLAPGAETTIAFTTDQEWNDGSLRSRLSGALQRRRKREASLVAAWEAKSQPTAPPPWMRHCVLAADQFVVRRATPGDPDGRSIIAGYHWFGDWGRDAMIALPGLSLVTGRPDVARSVLCAFGGYVDGGMLPNCFPESGQAPQYNTVDAALWFIEAVARYTDATDDLDTLRRLWPALTQIVTAYCSGTRYGIHVDDDGLVTAGAPGMQLTWMDAKCGDRVVTPRIGKPVEIAALWYNGLHRMALLAERLSESAGEYQLRAATARDGFQRFWNAPAGSCYDVLDGPEGDDATLRPNQIFAVALPYTGGGPLPLLSRERQQAVVNVCAAQLATSNGLRTLSSGDPAFAARYEGPPAVRDGSYHQGTAWAWLLGAFAVAHARAFGDAAQARSFLEPLADQLFDYGLGSVAEIADGSAPFRPRGAIAQAWSIGELLRAWYDVEE